MLSQAFLPITVATGCAFSQALALAESVYTELANLTNRAAAGMERLVEALRRSGPMDYRQAAAAAELSPNPVKNAGYLDALVSQGRIHIHTWRRGRHGAPRPVFKIGAGENAPRPTAQAPGEKLRAFRQRKLAANAADNFGAQLRLFLPRPPGRPES